MKQIILPIQVSAFVGSSCIRGRLLAFALAAVACSQSVSTSVPATGALSEEQRANARGTPAFASAEYTVEGAAAPLAGGFTLTVGPDEGQEGYTFTGHATDPESPTQIVQLNGRFDLRSPLNPPPMHSGITTRYDASGNAGLDWLLENRGSFNLVRNNGAVESYAIRTAEFLIDADGLLVGEFHGVNFNRISTVIAPGADTVVHVRGRAIGVCRIRLPSSAGTTGPDAVDPTNSRPRCAELFSGF